MGRFFTSVCRWGRRRASKFRAGTLGRVLARGELFGGQSPQALSMLMEGFPQLPDHSFQFGWIVSRDSPGDQGIDPILKAMWRQGRGPKKDASEVRRLGSIQEIL